MLKIILSFALFLVDSTTLPIDLRSQQNIVQEVSTEESITSDHETFPEIQSCDCLPNYPFHPLFPVPIFPEQGLLDCSGGNCTCICDLQATTNPIFGYTSFPINQPDLHTGNLPSNVQSLAPITKRFKTELDHSCKDTKCLENTYGPNAINMILSMFTMAGIDLPPHLAFLANQEEKVNPTSDDPQISRSSDEICTDEKCLENTYGPNAVNMILSMFTMAGIDLPPHLAFLANQEEKVNPTSDDPQISPSSEEICTDKKCLENTYGPNAVNMILSMFTMAGIDLPPHLAHLANQVENTPTTTDDSTETLPSIFKSFAQLNNNKN